MALSPNSQFGKPGVRLGGRQKGTPNKRTLDVAAMLEKAGCNPILGMAELAANPEASLELRGRMYSELAKYVAPQRKAVDVSSEDGTASAGPHEIIVRVVKPTTTDEEHQITIPKTNGVINVTH